MKEIRVLAAASLEALENGADVEYICETIAEAKKRAKYVLTEEYRKASEASTRLGYSQVVDRSGEVLYDYFNFIE